MAAMRASPPFLTRECAGTSCPSMSPYPDVVVAVDRVPHGLLHGPVGSDDRLIGAFAESVMQVDAVLFELAGEDAFDLSAQSADVARFR